MYTLKPICSYVVGPSVAKTGKVEPNPDLDIYSAKTSYVIEFIEFQYGLQVYRCSTPYGPQIWSSYVVDLHWRAWGFSIFHHSKYNESQAEICLSEL